MTLSYTAPGSGSVTVSSTIGTSTAESNVANNTASGSTLITPVAELSVSKSSTPQPYVPGAALTYTLVVTNAGPSDVIGAPVVDSLPGAAGGL